VDNDHRENILHQAFLGEGYRRDRSALDCFRYEGCIRVKEKSIAVAWKLKDLEFLKLPILQLTARDADLPGIVAHINRKSEYCYAQEGSLILDRYNIPYSIKVCLNYAQAALTDALSRRDHSGDIENEFVQHWLGESYIYADLRMAPSSRAVVAPHAAGKVLTDLQFVKVPRGSTPAWVQRTDAPLTFRAGQEAPSTWSEFAAWLATIDPDAVKSLTEHLTEMYPNLPLLFVRAPNATVGIRLDITSKLLKGAQRKEGFSNLLRLNGGQLHIERVTAERADPDYIFSRNQGLNIFRRKKVALLGCGTIGSHLAKFMAQSGVGANGGFLALVDQDMLQPGNLGRHWLGQNYIGQNKAEAVKSEIVKTLPKLNLKAVAGDAYQHLAEFSKYDVVVDATGEEAFSIALNHYFTERRYQAANAPTLIHVWLAGAGDAAQALLVEDKSHACYRCLNPRHEPRGRFSPLLSDYTPQEMPARCGESAYMPYGVAASALAAGLALSMLSQWATGASKPYLRTVYVSGRNTKMLKDSNPSRSEHCPACGRYPK